MTKRLARTVACVLCERPTIEMRFTAAIRPDPYPQGRHVLFLHRCIGS